jgi:hypothetical protein
MAVVLGSLALVLAQQPFGQDPSYHDFADRRPFFGIPNFFDVISNIPFAFIGIAGIRFCLRNPVGPLRPAWIALFSGVAFVSMGSAYYHWEPDNETLVWDRLPMTIGFAALFVTLVGEYASPRVGKAILVPALLLGTSSVFYWHLLDDLRLYLWVQGVPLMTIPVVLALFRSGFSHRWLLLGALGCYVLAKICEMGDRVVFAWTQGLISGHSLKHLLSALGMFAILWMLENRRALGGFIPSESGLPSTGPAPRTRIPSDRYGPGQSGRSFVAGRTLNRK